MEEVTMLFTGWKSSQGVDREVGQILFVLEDGTVVHDLNVEKPAKLTKLIGRWKSVKVDLTSV